MQVNSRSRASWSPFWRDLQIYKETFNANCRKLIGSGSETKVWVIHGIPRNRNFRPRPSSANTDIDFHMTGEQLIIENNWNVELLNDLFDGGTVNNILRIPFSYERTEDNYIWGEKQIR